MITLASPDSPQSHIIGIGHYLPDRVVTSEELEARLRERSSVSIPVRMIEQLSGVRERRFAGPQELPSDMAAQASFQAMSMAGIGPEDIDVVIFAAASHDVADPATSCILQSKIGAANAFVFDVKNACCSMMNALDVADSLIRSGRAGSVLIASGEVISPSIRYEIDTIQQLSASFASFTFGDGAAAMIVAKEARPIAGVIHEPVFASDGEAWPVAMMPGGGVASWGNVSNLYFDCDGPALLGLIQGILPNLITRCLNNVGWRTDDIDLAVPHQPALGVLHFICDQLGLGRDRCVTVLDKVGNTGGASIGISLSMAYDAGALDGARRLLLVGGGAGFSAGAVPLSWQD